MKCLKGRDVRPTADRVKESIFSRICTFLEGANVLDLYAGSGSLALESISRGAAGAVCVDNSRKSVTLIHKNIETLGFQAYCRVMNCDAAGAVKKLSDQGEKFGVVFIDPPYFKTGFFDGKQLDLGTIMLFVLERCDIVSVGGLVLVEHHADRGLMYNGTTFKLVNCVKFGGTAVSFFHREDAT